jgi:hypothetical protein
MTGGFFCVWRSSSGHLFPSLNRKILTVAPATPAVFLTRIDKIRPKYERLMDDFYPDGRLEKGGMLIIRMVF